MWMISYFPSPFVVTISITKMVFANIKVVTIAFPFKNYFAVITLSFYCSTQFNSFDVVYIYNYVIYLLDSVLIKKNILY